VYVWRARKKYGELARLVVDADVGDVHGVRGRRDGRAARRAHEIAHEARKGALLLAAAGEPLLRGIALIAVAVAARALGARGRGIHLAGERGERGRLAERGRLEQARGLLLLTGVRLCVLRRRGAARSWVARGMQRRRQFRGVKRGAKRGRRQLRELVGNGIVALVRPLRVLLVDGREERRRAP
jgi:hypothetical protein